MILYGKILKNYIRSNYGKLPLNWRNYAGMSPEKIDEKMNSLGCCKQAPTPCVEIPFGYFPGEVIQEEGNNPMIMSKAIPASNTSLSSISLSMSDDRKSDEMTQRDYLLGELRTMTRYDWQDKKQTMLLKMFNIDAPMYPKSSQELIDAFKNGKFTVDQAKVDKNTKYFSKQTMDVTDYDDEDSDFSRRFFGITFTDLPVADRTGWETAKDEYRKAQKDTERKIQIGSPADGLAALVAFEAWMPSNAPTTVH